MPNVFDGTNPITDILGDEPTEREVTMENQSTMTIIEPLTNTQIPAGQTVLVRVIGDMAHSTLVNNIQQINALQGLEVIGLTSVVIPDEPVAGSLLVPTGAIESVDGEFQRFTYDGLRSLGAEFSVWTAELALVDRKFSGQIKLKVPSLTIGQKLGVFVVDASADQMLTAEESEVPNFLLLLFTGGEETTIGFVPRDDPSGVARLILDPQPQVGDVITLTYGDGFFDYSFAETTGRYDLPADFFVNAPNVVVTSINAAANDVAALSISAAPFEQ